MADKIFSRCGNRCDLCLVYRPNVLKNDKRGEICATWDKLDIGKVDPATVICDGCLADFDGAVILSAGECKARSCVTEKGFIHCGYCSDYPCKDFPAEPDADEFYREMERRAVDWTAKDDEMMEPYNPKEIIDGWRKRNIKD